MKEREVDCMKYRKSTHLAGIDVEAIADDKGKCVLTIKDAYYEKGVDVSGNKTDGYFVEFAEGVKPLVVNSGNRKIISKLVKDQKGLSSVESRKVNTWIGLKVELFFDPSVKMMGKIVGGVKVKPTPVVIELKPLSDDRFKGALKSIEEGTTTIEKIKSSFKLTPEQEKELTK